MLERPAAPPYKGDMRNALVTLMAAAVVAAPNLVWAQDHTNGKIEAEQHYQTAVVLLSEGRFLEALAEFDAAIELSPQAVFYCNRALVLVKLDETREAVQSLKNCRDLYEGDEEELAQIDAQYHGLAAYEEIVRPHAWTVARDIAAGPLATNEPETPWNLSDFGLITMGVGAALMASAATVDLLSADLKQDFIDESEGGPGTSRERYDELKSDLELRQNLFWGMGGAGAVLLVAGGGMIAYHFATDDAPVTVAPSLGSEGIGVQILTNF
jgi:tetratricopeptide (TPR) repeat protein